MGSRAALPQSNVFGIDVSRYQGRMNWDEAAQHAQFAILQCSNGKNEDGLYSYHRAGCIANNIPWGVYHYARPDANWLVQADFFLGLLKESCSLRSSILPPVGLWLDCEETGGLKQSALDSWYNKFIGKVFAATGLKMGIYTRASFWNAALPGGGRTGWAKLYPLWVASWRTSKPYLPNDWTPPAHPDSFPYTFWQYDVQKVAADYGCPAPPYGEDDIDLDCFNGDEEAFNKMFGTKIKPLPGPGPEPAKYVQVTAKPWANIRATPEISDNDIGNLVTGGTFLPIGKSGEWYQLKGWVHESTVKVLK